MKEPSRSMAALLFFLGHVVNFIVNFLATPYLARSLSQHDFGTYGQVIMILDATNILFTFGLNNSMALALIEQNKADDKNIFSTFFALFGIMGIVGSLAIGIFSYISPLILGHSDAAPLLRWAAFCLLLFYLNHAVVRGLIYLGRSKYYVIANVLANILRVGCTFIAVSWYQSLWGVVMSVGLGWLFQVAVCMWAMPPTFFRGKIKTETFLPTLREGYLLGVNYQLQYAYLFVGGILVSYLMGVEQYAVYRSASIEIPLVSTLYMAIGTIIFPSLAAQIQEGHYEAVLIFKQRIIRQMVILIYPLIIFMVIFSDFFIQLYLSEKYAMGASVFAIINLSLLSKITDFSDILTMKKSYNTILRINLIYFGVFLVLSLLLTLQWGIIGTAISVTVSSFLLVYLYLKETLLSLGWTYHQLLDFRHLAVVTTFCTVIALILRVGIGYDNICISNFIGCWIIYFIIIYSLALYWKWVELPLYESIFNQTKIGKWIYHRLIDLSK